MRISDWSSDVCSSDLSPLRRAGTHTCPSLSASLSQHSAFLMPQLRAESAQDLLDAIADAMRAGTRLEIRGGGSKAAIGAPRDATILSTTGLVGVIDYDPAELVLTVRAGTPLAEVEALEIGSATCRERVGKDG